MVSLRCSWRFLAPQEKGQLLFEDKWPSMRPIVLKLLQQEPVSQLEWQDLFYAVHLVCLWDEKGSIKIRDALHEDIVAFIKDAQTRVRDLYVSFGHNLIFFSDFCINQFIRIYLYIPFLTECFYWFYTFVFFIFLNRFRNGQIFQYYFMLIFLN